MLQKLKKLSIPRSPTKLLKHQRVTPAHDPELFVDLYRYCRQDVRTEKAVGAAVPALSEFELKVWMLDQEINERGVQVDLEGLHNCKRMVDASLAKYGARLCKIIGDPNITVHKTEQLKAWINARGNNMSSFDEDAVQAELDNQFDDTEVFEVLEIRQAIGSAAVKKIDTMLRTVCRDGRIRGLFEYCGARQTGRWAGRMAQPQNLPRGGPAIKRVDEALFDFSLLGNSHLQNMLEAIESKYGNILDSVGSVLRGLFIAGPGKDLICSDYSAIEAIIVAELAEETWRQEVFRTHGKIYEASVSKMMNIPLEAVTEKLRQTGKTRELALGFGGTLGSYRKFEEGDPKSDEEIYREIDDWRDDSPKICGTRKRMGRNLWIREGGLWQGLDKAARGAVANPSMPFTYKYITYDMDDGNLRCLLPSGRYLYYHDAKMEMGEYGLEITFWGWNSDSLRGPVGWMKKRLWFGQLIENIAQAIARDILAHAMLNLNTCGYPPVLHIHDEPVSEIDKGFGSVGEFEFIMNIMPPWASGWPIKAKGGWRGRRYRKG